MGQIDDTRSRDDGRRPDGGGGDPNDPARRLLVVDDDPHVLEVVSELFASHGYSIAEATNARDAIALLDAEEFDGVVTDLSLRGDSGLDVLRAARRRDPDAVVVLVTGFASVSTAIGALREGVYDYLTKPFDLYQLSQVVERGIAARELARENRRLVSDLRAANARLRSQEEVLEAKVREATARLRTLYAVARDATGELDLTGALELIVTNAVRLVHAQVGLVFVPDEDSGGLRCAMAHGLGGEAHAVTAAPVTGGPLYVALQERRAFHWRPAGGDGVSPHERMLSQALDRDALVAPLEFKGEVVGLLVIGDPFDDRFDDDAMELLTLFALQAANALGNARQHEALKDVEQLKSDFVAMVSHELRTPLTAVKGSLDLLDAELHDRVDDGQRDLLRICDANCKRLLSIVNDVLDFSRLEASRLPLQLAPVDAWPLIHAAAKDMEALAAESEVHIRCDVGENLPQVVADEMRISQVLMNLLSNAIKFSPDGGEVVLRARAAHPDGLEFTVVDHGCGIRAADIPNLFQRFRQLDGGAARPVGGTGLGLVISKSIVEAHGGRIWVESEEGVGSTFGFILPADPLDATETDTPRLASLS